MTGYRVVNLAMMIEELGEGETKRILSDFSCPLNPDVEFFILKKAIEFAKQGWHKRILSLLLTRMSGFLLGTLRLPIRQ